MKTIDEILASDDLHSEIVEVPEWGTTVRVESITCNQRMSIELAWRQGNNKRAAVELLAAALKKPDGTPLGSREQIERLFNEKNSKPVDRLIVAASRVSALSEQEMQESVKN